MTDKGVSNMKNHNQNLVSTNSEMDDNYLFAASCQDATGLTPTIAHNEYEAASYEEIYPYLPSVMPSSPSAVSRIPGTDGIRAEMRKEVSPQNHKPTKRKNSHLEP